MDCARLIAQEDDVAYVLELGLPAGKLDEAAHDQFALMQTDDSLGYARIIQKSLREIGWQLIAKNKKRLLGSRILAIQVKETVHEL